MVKFRGREKSLLTIPDSWSTGCAPFPNRRVVQHHLVRKPAEEFLGTIFFWPVVKIRSYYSFHQTRCLTPSQRHFHVLPHMPAWHLWYFWFQNGKISRPTWLFAYLEGCKETNAYFFIPNSSLPNIKYSANVPDMFIHPRVNKEIRQADHETTEYPENGEVNNVSPAFWSEKDLICEHIEHVLIWPNLQDDTRGLFSLHSLNAWSSYIL